MTFFTIKVLHLLGAAVLFGTGLGIAFFTWAGWLLARRVDSIDLLRGILSLTVIADAVFTAVAVVVQPITGAALWWLAGGDWAHRWFLTVSALYIFVGACWLPVVFIQIRLRDAAHRAPNIRALGIGFHRAFRLWFALGIPAFVAVIALFALMVLRGRFPA